jgi:hypothetical protein
MLYIVHCIVRVIWLMESVWLSITLYFLNFAATHMMKKFLDLVIYYIIHTYFVWEFRVQHVSGHRDQTL